ncbi:MAG: DUF1761 domain-containing protein [Alphaproteobacteria bacterium]|nr:DUF1761 domain-containing protein [Alphaproteobacteria bacterium]
MAFAGIDYLAVLAAAVAAFAFGAAYYGPLGKAWLTAQGKDPVACKDRKPKPGPFIRAGIALLVMAWVMGGLMGHLGEGAYTVGGGILTGAIVWLGFVATTLVVNHGFQESKIALTLIDGGHWLGVLAIQGAVIALLGPPA